MFVTADGPSRPIVSFDLQTGPPHAKQNGGHGEQIIRILQRRRHRVWCLLSEALSPGVFPNLAESRRAKQDLSRDGRVEEDVISASGEEVVHFAEDHLLKDGSGPC